MTSEQAVDIGFLLLGAWAFVGLLLVVCSAVGRTRGARK